MEMPNLKLETVELAPPDFDLAAVLLAGLKQS